MDPIFILFDTITEDETLLQLIFSIYNSKYTGPAIYKKDFII